MSREELIKRLEETYKRLDHEGDVILVNFVDDEIHWDLIARIAVGVIQEAWYGS